MRLTCYQLIVQHTHHLLLYCKLHLCFDQIQDEDGVYGVALVAPPVTPYPAVNPSFRVFTMDPNSLMLTGYQQYHLNLTKANGGCNFVYN